MSGLGGDFGFRTDQGASGGASGRADHAPGQPLEAGADREDRYAADQGRWQSALFDGGEP